MAQVYRGEHTVAQNNVLLATLAVRPPAVPKAGKANPAAAALAAAVLELAVDSESTLTVSCGVCTRPLPVLSLSLPCEGALWSHVVYASVLCLDGQGGGGSCLPSDSSVRLIFS